MNRIRGPRLADPTKEHHRYLRALPEGNHFIEVTFRNIRTGESFPPGPHGKMYMLTTKDYKWISERHPLPDTPEQALACYLEMALAGGVKPRSRPKHNPDHEPVYAKYQRAFLFGEQEDKLAKTKTELIQDYLEKRYPGKRGGPVWTRARQNLSRTLDRRLKSDFPEEEFPRQ